MPSIHTSSSRRRFLGMLGLGGVFLHVPGAFAQALVETPRPTEGSFYPGGTPSIENTVDRAIAAPTALAFHFSFY